MVGGGGRWEVVGGTVGGVGCGAVVVVVVVAAVGGGGGAPSHWSRNIQAGTLEAPPARVSICSGHGVLLDVLVAACCGCSGFCCLVVVAAAAWSLLPAVVWSALSWMPGLVENFGGAESRGQDLNDDIPKFLVFRGRMCSNIGTLFRLSSILLDGFGTLHLT